MGSHRIARRPALGGTSSAKMERNQGGAETPSPVLVPLTDIKEKNAAKYIFSVPPSDLLRIEMDGGQVLVSHQNRPIGLLARPHSPKIERRIRDEEEVICRLHSVWGSPDDPNAIVAVWI